MTAMSEDTTLASQCLDLCQMLAGKSLSFSFTLKVGNNFSFSVDSRGKGALSPQKKKKKPTPSTLRRNARRREEFLRKKLAPGAEKSEQQVSEEETDHPGNAAPAPEPGQVSEEDVKCEQCDFSSKSNRGLKTHISRIHKVIQKTEDNEDTAHPQPLQPRPTPSTSTPPPSAPSPSPPVILKKPVKMLNGDPIWKKK